jgi:4-alpha-glucanotransferase
MKFERSSGILLHPTSLSGPFGIGDVGPGARRWLEFLDRAGCALWQVLPLGPTGFGDSPYQCFSAFAGNPYLVSPEVLVEDSLIDKKVLTDHPRFAAEKVDYGEVIAWKLGLLDQAFYHFENHATSEFKTDLEAFQIEQASWLDDFALFMAIKEYQGGGSWSDWPLALRMRDKEALQSARISLSVSIRKQIFRQFLFFRQWSALRTYAHKLGIQIIGDIPIFVAHDSADVWAHTDLFYIDRNGKPTVVAGVPPDYFSPTGQLWGNPLYRWEAHAQSGYAWWLARFKAVLQAVDIVRLDHFRGFAGYWEVPAGNPTAEIGRWVHGPGKPFLKAIHDGLGELPIIAEDLGVITPDVVEMRDVFNLPGMKIFQFAFSTDPDDPFLPHNYPNRCVVYTGTHDNDTVLGWFATAPEKEQKFCLRYLDSDGRDLSRDMVRAIWRSVATFSLAPMQDLLSLGTEARMNFPGHPSGNWTWRMSEDSMTDELCQSLYEINYLYSRIKPDHKKDTLVG